MILGTRYCTWNRACIDDAGCAFIDDVGMWARICIDDVCNRTENSLMMHAYSLMA